MMRKSLLTTALLTAGLLIWSNTSEAVTVSVSDVTVDPGQAGVVVSVAVDSARGIAGGNFTLSYPAEVMTAKQAKGTDLAVSAGITVVPNLNTAGQVRVSMAGATGIASGAGALLTVTFDVKAGAAAGRYDLALEASLKDENGRAIPVTVRKGVLTVKATGGRIVSVSDVIVDPGQTGVVVTVGADSAKGIAGGNFTLSYNPDILTAKQVRATDLVTSAGVTAIPNLSAPGSIRVSMAGATGIASGSGALLTVTFDVKAGASPGVYDLGLEASLKDENGRAIPVTARKGVLTVKAVGGRTVSVSNARVSLGVGVVVSISVDSARGIAGGNFTLTYPADVLTAKRAEGTGLVTSAGITVISNLNTAGQVRVSMAGATGIPPVPVPDFDSSKYALVLVTVTFDVKAGATAGTYDLSLEASLKDENGRAIPVAVKKGTLTVQTCLLADFDCSGEVDFNDFFLFAAAFGQKATEENRKFDLDGDGEFGFNDFFIFANAFGKT